jgi:ABC-type branched-subunit amino acid transport system substrate-binding protein
VRRALAAAAVLVSLTGCKSLHNVARGGKIVGDTLTVYSLLPQPGTGNARDFVDAEKLALYSSGGTAGEFAVNFVSIDEGRRSPVALRDALADPQIVALIGPFSSAVAKTVVPLFNSAGVLQLTPGAGYAGFTEPVRAGEPERWQPSGRRTLWRLAGDDIVQARAMLAAARAATERDDPRVAIEQEPGRVPDGLVAALHEAGARTVGDSARADAVIYVGDDPDNAVGVADALAEEAPRASVVFPDTLTFAGIEGRLSRAARRRAVLMSSAPAPGSTPQLRDFAARFRERYGRTPGPYAVLGYRAMGGVMDAVGRAGDRAGYRQTVIDEYFSSAAAPPPFTAFRPGRGYLRLG